MNRTCACVRINLHAHVRVCDPMVVVGTGPMNMFRSGGDMRADWRVLCSTTSPAFGLPNSTLHVTTCRSMLVLAGISIDPVDFCINRRPLMLRRLQTIVPFLRLSRPGCWGYLDMLEVGHPPGGTGEGQSFENVHSWRTHFAAWAIASSPLILSLDLANQTLVDLVWPFVTNKEVLAINSQWSGEAGRLVSSSYDQTAPTPMFARPCSSSVDTQKFMLEDGKLVSKSKSDKRCGAFGAKYFTFFAHNLCFMR